MDVTLETRTEAVKTGEQVYEEAYEDPGAETFEAEVGLESEGLNEPITDHTTATAKKRKNKKKKKKASSETDDMVTARESQTEEANEVVEEEGEKEEEGEEKTPSELVAVEEGEEETPSELVAVEEEGEEETPLELVATEECPAEEVHSSESEISHSKSSEGVPRRTCVVLPSPGQSPVPSPNAVVKGTAILGTASTPVSSSMDSRKAWCLDIKELSIKEETAAVDREIPYEKLVEMTVDNCEGINWERREDYLSQEEFVEVFKLTRDAFKKLAAWRRLNLKKKVGLF